MVWELKKKNSLGLVERTHDIILKRFEEFLLVKLWAKMGKYP